MAKTKFLFLAQLPPPIHGVSMMSKQVYDMVGTLGAYEIDYLWSGSAKNLNDIDKKSLGKIFGFATLVMTLVFRFVSGKRYDTAYLTFAPWTHAAIRDGFLAWLAGLSSGRVLLHLHGEGLTQVIGQKGIRNKLIYWLIQKSELVAITGSSAALARQSAIFSKVHLLPNFVANPANSPLPKTSRTTGGEGKRSLEILFLGNLDPRKGVLQFLDFIQALDKEGLAVKAKIVGAATKFLSVEDVRKEGEKRNIGGLLSVLGPRYGQDKTDFLRQGDIFLYPSRHDYAPLVLIEAMSAGLIPITYDTGGIAEIAGDYFQGHVISPRLPQPVQNSIVIGLIKKYSADYKTLEQDKAKARLLYEQKYTKEKFIHNFTSILDSTTLDHNPELQTVKKSVS